MPDFEEERPYDPAETHPTQHPGNQYGQYGHGNQYGQYGPEYQYGQYGPGYQYGQYGPGYQYGQYGPGYQYGQYAPGYQYGQYAPTMPPPNYIPPKPVNNPGSIRTCVDRMAYVWFVDGRNFWAWISSVTRRTIYGYRWSGHHWVYFEADIDTVDTFVCT